MWPTAVDSVRLLSRDDRGVAATEFALIAMVFIMGMLNAFDVGRFFFQKMQVDNAAYSGAHASWTTCSDQTTMLPATQNCPGLTTAITSAVHSTSLGSTVSLASTAEGYYCVTSSNTLQFVGSTTSKPTNCSAAGNPSISPGDYIAITVSFNFKPMFGISVIGLKGASTITKTSWMRLG